MFLLFVLKTLWAASQAATIYDTVCSGSFAAGQATDICSVLDYSAYSSVKSILTSTSNSVTFFPVSNQGLQAARWSPDYWQNSANYAQVTANLQYLILQSAVKTTDIYGSMNVYPTFLQGGSSFANTTSYQVSGFYQNPQYPAGATTGKYYGSYFDFGRDVFDSFGVSYQVFDVACDNGVVQFMNRLPTLPIAPTTQLKNAGFTQYFNAIQKAGLASFINSVQGLTLFAVTDDVMEATLWSQLSLADLSTLILAHVYRAADQGPSGNVLYSGTFTATTLVDVQGNPTTVQLTNGLPELYGAANTDYYPTFPARVIQNQILTFNGVIQTVTNVILSKPIAFSKVPLLPQQWTANTIDPPQGQGFESYFFLDTYQAGNYYPSAHWFQYGPNQCSKLETVSGTNSYVYYLNCPALCCYEVLGTNIKQWAISPEATPLGNQTIQSFGQNIVAEGWEMIYNPNTLKVTYDYWVTYDAKTGAPQLQRIDYNGVGVPPGAIQYQNYAQIPANQQQAFASTFYLPSVCQPNNLLPCDNAMTDDERLAMLVRFGDVHRVKNSPLNPQKVESEA